MNSKLQSEYRYNKTTDVHIYSVVGGAGTVHLHFRQYADECHGGIEQHYRYPPAYRKHDAPDQIHCWLLGGPCWHDGSSLQVEEVWAPLWKSLFPDHIRMLELLEGEYYRLFVEVTDE